MAQSADLWIDSSRTFTKARSSEGIFVNVTFGNRGPGDALDVVVTIDPEREIGIAELTSVDPTWRCNTSGRPFVCTISRLAPHDQRSIIVREVMPVLNGTYVTTYAIESSTPEVNATDNHGQAAITVTTEPNLFVNTYSSLGIVAPGSEYGIDVSVSNYSSYPAHELTVSGTAAGFEIAAVSPAVYSANISCAVTSPATFACTRPLLSAGEGISIHITVRVPLSTPAGLVQLDLTATALESNYGDRNRTAIMAAVAQIITVSTSADDGPGSYRQALVDARICGGSHPCRIVFAIDEPVPANGWFTIRLRSPLPAVTGRSLRIDATTQTAFSGDTNPAGPEIELDGSGTVTGHGVDLLDSPVRVEGFSIVGFPENGIAVHGKAYGAEIAGNYIGVDPSGTRAVANYRGIFIDGGTYAAINNNVISGNTRSGIWSLRGKAYASGNRIGTAADGKSPLPNGGSGIFIGSSWVTLSGNIIAYNGEMGVAAPHGISDLAVSGGSIHDNGGLGIDYGLDGDDPLDANFSSGQPNAPLLISATYDSAKGETIITATVILPPGAYAYHRYMLFANGSADAEGETPLATTYEVSAGGMVTMHTKGDHRGKWLTATTTRVRLDDARTPAPEPPASLSGLRAHPDIAAYEVYFTSEFSNAVLAQ
jgi:Right handed beta helix region